MLEQFRQEEAQQCIKSPFFSAHIQSLPIREEKTLIICNQLEEAEQVAKHFAENGIPFDLVRNINSDCKYTIARSFYVIKHTNHLKLFPTFPIQMEKTN